MTNSRVTSTTPSHVLMELSLARKVNLFFPHVIAILTTRRRRQPTVHGCKTVSNIDFIPENPADLPVLDPDGFRHVRPVLRNFPTLLFTDAHLAP